MTTIEARHATPAKRTESSTSAKGEKPKTAGRASSAQTTPSKADSDSELHTARVTKHLCFSFQPTDRVFNEKLYV